MVQPPFPQFVNFLAATRKPMLIPAMYFSPGDNISFIWAVPGTSTGAPVALTGTIDGFNRVFTVPGLIVNGAAIYRNGLLQDPALSYSIVGQTVTFNDAPIAGDDLMTIVS